MDETDSTIFYIFSVSQFYEKVQNTIEEVLNKVCSNIGISLSSKVNNLFCNLKYFTSQIIVAFTYYFKILGLKINPITNKTGLL